MAHPDLVTRMAALDPDLGLHGYAHVNHSRLHVRGLAAELADGLAALRAILPYHEVRFCRFPYGDSASRSDATALLVRHGLTAVGWDYASRDWDVTISDAEAWERIRPACVRGGVVLFHSWVPRTARLIARLLDHEGPAHAVRFRDIPLPYVSDHGLVYLNPQA